MKTLEQIKDGYANEQGRDNWKEYFKWLELCHTPHDVMQKHYEEISKRYAEEYARESLRLASHSVRPKEFRFYDDYERCEKSILSENNLPKH